MQGLPRASFTHWTEWVLAHASLFFFFAFALLYPIWVPILLYAALGLKHWPSILLVFLLLSSSRFLQLCTPAPWKWFKESRLFVSWRGYFSFALRVPTQPYAKENVLFVFQPHSVFPFGLTLLSGLQEKFVPPGTEMRVAIASNFFWVPLFAPMLRWLGCVEATDYQVDLALQTGNCIVVPEGIAGVFSSTPNGDILYLENRHGFIRSGLKRGAQLVPIYCFGQSSAFHLWKGSWLQDLSRRVRFALAFYRGRPWCPVLPNPTPTTAVFGAPIQLPKILTPSEADVIKWQRRYLDELHDLYETHKEEYAALEARQTSLHFI